jgi:hypothetical protein
MTVQCKIGEHVTTVDSEEDCRASFGTPVGADAGTGGGGGFTIFGIKVCFVRNVLTRSLGDMILDIGASDSIAGDVPVDLLARGKVAGKGRSKPIALSPARKRRYATALSKNILTLAATYQSTIDFRDHILLATARGKQLKAHYDAHLPAIYAAAGGRSSLLRESAQTWMALHPFVARMVEAAGASSSKRKRTEPRLTSQNVKRCVKLIRSFQAASEDRGFQSLLGELEAELSGYSGLTASQALQRLRNAPAR